MPGGLFPLEGDMERAEPGTMVPVAELPRFRADLIVKHQDTAEGSFFVVKDPRNGRFFRFREAEHLICRQLDGATSVDAIGKRIEEDLGKPLAARELEAFVQSLGRIGLLEAGRGTQGDPASSRQPWVRGSALYLRFKAFDPDRLLNRLAGRVGFFFTPHFLVLSALVIAWALSITVVSWDDISRDFGTLWRFDALAFAWLTVLSVTALHEFAHGMTCKHFGGEVHEMGFMLIYFQPAFYCNVSDAWLFPEKSKRLWVTFSGAYFEVFLWALATLTWRAAAPGTWVSFAALVIMATSGIKELFNLNPLIKLDGYYLLSDYLEIPNLRQKSVSHLRALLGRASGSAAKTAPATPRQRRIYVLYGLLAGAYSLWLLGYVVLAFGSYLMERYQAVGTALFGGFLVTLFRNSLRRVLSRITAPFRGILARMGSRRLRIVVASAFGLAVLLLGRMELKVSGEFTVLPIHNADVHAEVAGIIQDIPVEQGDAVEEGQVIAVLSDRDTSKELHQVRAQLLEKQANLAKLRAGPRPEEIELARSEVGKAEARLKHASNNRDRLEPLVRQEFVSQREVDDAAEQVAVLTKELEVARGGLRILQAGSRREEIDAAQAEVARLEVQERYLQEELGRLKVVSPVSGIVTTSNLKEKVGQHVEKGDLIAKVHELKTVRAEIAVPEKEIADVRPGQKVVLRARAYPGLKFEGKVISIAPIVTKHEERVEQRTVVVTTELENTSLLLKSEMTGNAKIFCGPQRILDLMTRKLAHYLRVEFWSYW